MIFEEELLKYQKLINDELTKYLRKYDCYEKTLNDSIEYSLMAGGKRLRALMVIDTYKMFKDDYEKCLPFAIALEMVHNFSLIHDDLPEIDNDDFRHGKPTNHKKFNHATALLAGDDLFNYAYQVISDDLLKSANDSNLKNKLIAFNEFTKAVDKMIIGEYLDTELEGKEISLDLLKYIHKNKTAELLKLAVKLGAILADAPQKDIDNLANFADKIGLAFQIKDDILSEEGDEKILGKPIGNDKELKKCTYVSFYGLAKAKEELNKVIDDALNDIKPYNDKALFLKELALYFKNRNK